MQLALATGSPDRGTASDAPTRANLVLAAGVALAAAGVIAVNPVAPVLPLHAHRSAVQLTGTWDTAADNWANLQELISANPDPIGKALDELTDSYNAVSSTSIEDSMAGIQGIWSGHGAAQGLETLLPLISEYLQDGNATEAFNLFNQEMLFDMLNVFQPLFNYVPHGGTDEVAGLAGLGPTMLRDWANVQDVFADFSTWKNMSEALMSPAISAMYAMSDSVTDTGNHTPQNVLDAFLNGYIPWDPQEGSDTVHAPLVGLLTEDGPIDYFSRILPETIANAMTQGLTDDAPISDIATAGFDLFA